MASLVLQQLDTYGPDRCDQLDYDKAVEFTHELVRAQYENFTVISWLLPKRLRDHFANVLWVRFWDVIFSLSSATLCFLFGAALGNLIRGVEFDAEGWFFLPLWTDFGVGAPVGVPTSASSQSRRWKLDPSPISARVETQRLWRSSDLGVNRISGLRKLRCSCRRRMWK